MRKALQKVDVDELAIAGARLELEAGQVDFGAQGDVLELLAAVPEHALWLARTASTPARPTGTTSSASWCSWGSGPPSSLGGSIAPR